MFGPFKYRWPSWCEVSDDDVRFVFNRSIMIDVLGGTWGPKDCEANLRICERHRSRIEAACRKARTRVQGVKEIGLAKGDFVQITSASSADAKLVLTFPDSKTAQQFGGWVYTAGYPERIISQNTVTVDVLQQDRERIMQEVADRNGRVVPEH
jgi:hypothetical protein